MIENNKVEPAQAFSQARLAGLGKMVEQFPDDVIAAAATIAKLRATIPALNDVTTDAWPPMRIRSVACTG